VEEVADTLPDHIILVLTVKEVVVFEHLLLMDIRILSREVCVIPLHSRESMNNTFLVLASSQ